MKLSLDRWVLAIIGIGMLYGRTVAAVTTRPDVHSYSNPEQIRLKRVVLDLDVSFEKRTLEGTATLHVLRQPGCPPDAPLILDTRDLTIAGVTAGGKPVKFDLGKAEPFFGSPLKVFLPPDATSVQVRYRTSPTAAALQWLDAGRTAGKKKPFLYTQSQAILGRSWIPIQDTPGVRITYGARIRVPPGFTAVMSADHKPAERTNQFDFEMSTPIPCYLLALAVGELVFRALGPRSGVYAEPSVLAAAAHEFAETESMITTVEKRYGPYRWGRYDLLVLPPSFPMGGMENPRLTFATPTILAGDRSLVAVVAHELAHSWSGNLVNNATWADFWLNEGFTVYIERRVLEDLYGQPRSAMNWALGIRDLRHELPELKPGDQILHVDLAGRDPDDGVTSIPYEKGGLFLVRLEQLFGRDRFDTFLKDYFDHFAFTAVTTAEFVQYLKQKLLDPNPTQAARLNLDLWLYKPGVPPDMPEPKSERLDTVLKAADQWTKGEVKTADLKVADWTTTEWLNFLLAVPEKLGAERMKELDARFHFTGSTNSEIAGQWLLMAARNDYQPARKRMEDFLLTVGRRKFVLPIYKELLLTAPGKPFAKDVYARARSFYHQITVDSIDKAMKDAK